MPDLDHTQLFPGMTVVDLRGETVGRIRSVYPHYLAVETETAPPVAFRVPPHTFASLDGGSLHLSIPRDALDEMTPSTETGESLPRHGGPTPQD